MKYFPNLVSAALLAVGFLASCSVSNKPEAASHASPSVSTTSNLPGEVAPYNPTHLPLHRLKLPPGFRIAVFAAEVENARSLARGDAGTIFVGTRKNNRVFALRDDDGDGVAEEKFTIDRGLRMPNGVAFRDGDLYVAEVSRILRYRDIESRLADPPEPEVIRDDFPTDAHHGWKYIAFGPDGWLYVPVGAPCNICYRPETPIYASITRMKPDGSQREIYAEGIRNTVGFDWHPETGELWFTDNGRDMMGDSVPPCEVNRAPEPGLHFGYPFCHGGDIPDPEFGAMRDCDAFVPPVMRLTAHSAPLGLEFYEGEAFPENYRGDAFFAQHGSWNRSNKVGYKVGMADFRGEQVQYKTFVEGWLDEASQDVWGRPVDLLELPDGSVLLSDDEADVVYRITYAP